MSKTARIASALGCVLMLVLGCSSQPDPPAQSPPTGAEPPAEIRNEPLETESPPVVNEPPDSPAAGTPNDQPPPEELEHPPATPVEPVSQETSPPPQATPPPQPAEPGEPPATDPSAQPAPDPEPSPVAPPPSPEAPAVVDIGGPVEVAAAKPGLTRIGAGKCKICHKVQFASWSETAHGTRIPPLDCENCHGPGSEYKSKKIMADPESARAAGLVDPDLAFCAQCHTGNATDDLLPRAHAHKEDAP